MVTKENELSVVFYVEGAVPRARVVGSDGHEQNLNFLCAFAFSRKSRQRSVHIGGVKDVLLIRSDGQAHVAYLLATDGVRLFYDDLEVREIEVYASARDEFERAVPIPLCAEAPAAQTNEESVVEVKKSPAVADDSKVLAEKKPSIRELKLFGNPNVPMAVVGKAPFNFLSVFDENAEVDSGEQEIVIENVTVAYATRVPNRPKTFEIRPNDGVRLVDKHNETWPFLLLIFRSAGAKRLASDGVQGISESVLGDTN
jgi:hypothetical protein